MENKQTVNYGNVFIILLTILFIGLKLTGHIAWSWWWVLSPLWISVLASIIIIGIIALYFTLKAKSYKRKREIESDKQKSQGVQ